MPGPLLNREVWRPLFEPLKGRRIGLVDGDGNAGDRLLYKATRQLLLHFGLSWRNINILADPLETFKDEVDVLLVFAGGAIGGWRPVQLLRKQCLATKIPCIQLPSTYIEQEEQLNKFEKVYVREHHSLRFNPKAEVLPDLALGFDFPLSYAPHIPKVLSLRTDVSKYPNIKRKFDATAHCYSVEDYIHMVSRFQWIVTDRLHMAIIGLGLGRRVTLIPHFHIGNFAMWEESLKSLGCEWENGPEKHLNTPFPKL